MNKIRQILIFLNQGVSQRKIEKEVRVNRRTIASYLEKFKSTGLTFHGLLKLSDRDIDEILGLVKEEVIEDIDPRRVHFLEHLKYYNEQLTCKEGVTRLLLWEEYIGYTNETVPPWPLQTVPSELRFEKNKKLLCRSVP